MRRTHLAAHGVTRLQVKLADLRRRNIDVVRAGQVVVVRRTEEAISIWQYFQHTFGEDVALFLALRLQDLENEVLLPQAAGAGEVQGAGNLGQFSDVLFF